MIRFLIVAATLAGLTLPGVAGGGLPPSIETCDTLAESIASARQMAANHHAVVTFLDGDQAHRFLAAVTAPGNRFQVGADHIAVFLDPNFNSGFVRLANNVCGGFGTDFPMTPFDIRAALAAAVQQR